MNFFKKIAKLVSRKDTNMVSKEDAASSDISADVDCNTGHVGCRQPNENSFCKFQPGHTTAHSCGSCKATF